MTYSQVSRLSYTGAAHNKLFGEIKKIACIDNIPVWDSEDALNPVWFSNVVKNIRQELINDHQIDTGTGS